MTTTPLTAAQLADLRVDLTAPNSGRRAIPVSHYARVLLAERDRLAAELGRVRAELTTAREQADAFLAQRDNLHNAVHATCEALDAEVRGEDDEVADCTREDTGRIRAAIEQWRKDIRRTAPAAAVPSA